MYIGTQRLMQKYDECLLDKGYSIEELVDKASDVLLKYMKKNTYALFCGPGNNGADGLSLAIKLYNQSKKVIIYVFETENTSYAFQYYYNQCVHLGIDIKVIDDDIAENLRYELSDVEVVVDAIFGFGLNKAIRGIYARVIDEINLLFEQDIISVDIPSGLDCNSGIPKGTVICATMTISLSALKNSFLNLDTRLYTGKLIIDFLDVVDVSEEVGLFELYEKKHAIMHLKKRLFNGYKNIYGTIGLVAGCIQYKGAALLASKAAVYSGSGIVALLSDDEVLESCTQFVPEVITFNRDNLNERSYNAMLVGSGLGLSIESENIVQSILNDMNIPLVIDGDGLTIVSKNLELLKAYQSPVVITPHLGEFKRLCHCDDIDDPLIMAKEFALEYKVVVVLKGPYTIVSDGYESYRIHSGNKAMATAGMGDVLAGMITSFLGQGYLPVNAAALATYIHGYTGDKIASDSYTVIPSELIELIPKSMKELIDLQYKNI